MPFSYTSTKTSHETGYEAFFSSSHETPDEDYYELPVRQSEGLTLKDQMRLGQQRLRVEKKESRQKATIAADRARIGSTINEQRAYFHAKSRPFALQPNKALEPLPAAVGDLTRKQLVLQLVQAALIVAPTPVALPPVVAPVVVPAAVAPMPHFGLGKMYNIL